MPYRFFWLVTTPSGLKSWDGATPPPEETMRAWRASKARCIESPDDETRQRGRELTNVMRRDLQLWPSPYAHAYRVGRSIVSNARPHLGMPNMLTMDVRECYDHIHPEMVFREIRFRAAKVGWSDDDADRLIFALTQWCFISTDRVGRPHLPTGHPESPYLLNIALRGLDYRIEAFLKKRDSGLKRSLWLPIVYTRYSDNLTFSSFDRRVLTLDHAVSAIAATDRLEMNKKKTRRLGPGVPHRVCGVVTNTRLSVGRDRLRRTRARVHQLVRDFKDNIDIPASEINTIRGEVSFVWSVSPQQGTPLIKKLSEVNLWRVQPDSASS